MPNKRKNIMRKVTLTDKGIGKINSNLRKIKNEKWYAPDANVVAGSRKWCRVSPQQVQWKPPPRKAPTSLVATADAYG